MGATTWGRPYAIRIGDYIMIEHNRKSIRLKEYDYSSAGAYFVTICLQNRMPLFKNSDASEIIKVWLKKIEENNPIITVDCYVIMPDHIHFILFIRKSGVVNLSDLICWFKTMTTNEYIKGVKENRLDPFEKRLWQRGYYEHIIRNTEDLNEKRKYIAENPVKSHA